MQTISLLNAVFHTHAIDKAKARVDAGHYSAPLNLDPAASGTIGYPIFRVDYSNDEYFELYKMYWDQILEEEFYVLEAVDPDDVTWYWVDDEAKLDGKGPQEVRQ